MKEALQFVNSTESKEKINQRELGFFLHAYQPPREICLLDGKKLQVFPEINESIYHQTYEPLLIKGDELLNGVDFSLYGTLREWIKGNHREDFKRFKEKLERLPDKEYRVMGDPYLHVILPLLPKQDQKMLLEIGKRAFQADLGFEPKGFWLPETAVDTYSLGLVASHGYKYVVLNSSQLEKTEQNPVFVKSDNGEIAVFHFDPRLSGEVAFNDPETVNGDVFLDHLSQNPKNALFLGMDFETFGHHKPQRDKFLTYTLNSHVLGEHGFLSFDVASKLRADSHFYTKVKEFSSWSCPHELGRWTGDDPCNCDSPSETVKQDKRDLFRQLDEYNDGINEKLTSLSPVWRDNFIEAFLNLREKIFTGSNFISDFRDVIRNEEKERLFLAKLYTLIGFTSCGWFFGDYSRAERQIPQTMIEQVEQLLQE